MTARAAIAVAATVAMLVGGGYLAAGPASLLVTTAAAAAATVLAARAVALPSPPARPPGPPPSPRAWPSNRFSRYEKIADLVSWAPTGGRHFEYGARRLIRDLTAQRLADRYGIDLSTEPTAARAVLGERCWPLLDPQVTFADDPRGTTYAELVGLVAMLEQL